MQTSAGSGARGRKLPTELLRHCDSATLETQPDEHPFVVLMDGPRATRKIGASTRTLAAALAFARGRQKGRPAVYALDPAPARPAWKWRRVAMWIPAGGSGGKDHVDQQVGNFARKSERIGNGDE